MKEETYLDQLAENFKFLDSVLGYCGLYGPADKFPRKDRPKYYLTRYKNNKEEYIAGGETMAEALFNCRGKISAEEIIKGFSGE